MSWSHFLVFHVYEGDWPTPPTVSWSDGNDTCPFNVYYGVCVPPMKHAKLWIFLPPPYFSSLSLPEQAPAVRATF